MSEWDNLTPHEEMEKNDIFRENSNNHPHKILVSSQTSTYHSKNLEKINVYEVLEYIRTGKWKKTIEKIRNISDKKERQQKKQKLLHYFTFNGIFKHRSKDTLIKSSGLMTLDWDEEYQEEKVKPFFDKICSDPHVYACFRSPSGALKFLIKIPIVKDDSEFKEFYQGAINYFSKKNIILDTSGSDISRCCYASYDPELYYNPDCETFTEKFVAEQKEEKKAIIKAEKKEITQEKKDIPRHCELIEQFFSKQEVVSQNGITKNQYVDPFLANYSKYNKKPEILEAYINFEGKSPSKFNNSDGMGFNCGSLINYCKKGGHKEQIKYCKKCPYFEEYVDKVEDFVVRPNAERQEVQIYLKKLSDTGNELFIEDKLQEIKESSGISMGALRQQLRTNKKKTKYKISLDCKYNIEKTDYGTFFVKEQYDPEINDTIKYEVASFKVLKKEIRIDIDVFNKTVVENSNNIFSIPLLNPEKHIEAENEVETSFVLEKCKHNFKYVLSSDDIAGFLNIFNNDPNISPETRQQVNIYCYQNNKYYEPKEYDCYNETQTIHAGIRKINKIKGLSSVEFEEFLEIKPDKSIVKQCVKDLNSLPVNHDDAQIWKGILCKSIAMMLKMDLVNMGVTFFPIDVIMGDKGTGKTTLNKLLVRSLWNSKARSNSELSGSIGARLDYPNDIRPIVYEELTEFKKNWIDLLKEGMTRGVFTIKKGTADGGMRVSHIYQNMFLDTNEFNVNDEAFEQRICFWHKNIRIDGKDNMDIINNLEANIKHVGRVLYNNFCKIDTKKLWKQANQDIKTLFPTRDIRKGIKYSQIRFGELVLESILPELFEGVMLDYETLLDKKSYFLFNKSDMLKDKIKLLLSKVSIRVPDHAELTISSFAKEYSQNSSAQTQLYDKYGLIVSTGGNVCITRNFLSLLNKELEGIKKFNSLKEISTILGIENKITEHEIGLKKTTKTAINIMSLIDEDD